MPADTLTVIFSLIGVVAFILAMFWAARRFQKKFGYSFSASGKNLSVEESVSLSPDTRLIVASVDGRRFLIGVGNAHFLTELRPHDPHDNEEETKSAVRSERMPIKEAFKVVLSEKLGKNSADTHGDSNDVGKES
jgi:flagellar biogenesis protein FliO